jgi:hypothetical protein
MSERTNAIVEYLKNNGQANANNIAQNACDMKKASGGLRKLLQQMVADGEIVEDNSGRYTEYKVPAASSATASVGKPEKKSKKKSKKKDKKGKKSASTETVADASPNRDARKIGSSKKRESALPAVDLPGFDAVAMKDGSVEVTGPKKQTATLAPGEYLVVINNDFSYAATTPAEVIAAISDYAKDKGMATFTVKNMKTNSVIGTDKDIELGESRILCLEIAKHNKAA